MQKRNTLAEADMSLKNHSRIDSRDLRDEFGRLQLQSRVSKLQENPTYTPKFHNICTVPNTEGLFKLRTDSRIVQKNNISQGSSNHSSMKNLS